MSKRVKSANFKLMVLLVLVIGLAVGIFGLGTVTDNRSSAAGSCSGSVSHTYKPCTAKSVYPNCAGGSPVSEKSSCSSFNGGVCGYSFNKRDCRAVLLPGTKGFCDDNGSSEGSCNVKPKNCGGVRGSCSGSCPNGQVCRAPNPGNGENCGCHKGPKPTKKK